MNEGALWLAWNAGLVVVGFLAGRWVRWDSAQRRAAKASGRHPAGRKLDVDEAQRLVSERTAQPLVRGTTTEEATAGLRALSGALRASQARTAEVCGKPVHLSTLADNSAVTVPCLGMPGHHGVCG